MTEKRFDLFNKVVAARTRQITIALEDIYQPHNASAVLRSCDCFGIQDVHIIENNNEYDVNPDVALGASKWLNLNKYNEKENNTMEAINTLRADGYRIVATTPHTDDVDLHDFDLGKGKVALFFGTEQDGLSDAVLDNADEFMKTPMHGFTESFNISVSAAIIMHHLTLKLREGTGWSLSTEEKEEIMVDWLKTTIKKSDLIIENYNNEKSQ